MTLSIDEYLTISRPVVSEIKVKGSRFIARLFSARSKNIAEMRYEQVCNKYHNATHNCFAYRINENIFRYSDDGEPSGTAGKPILQVLEGQNIFEVLCVITRYFGGTKLGTGGLIRAYSQAATDALIHATIKTSVRRSDIEVKLKYEHENMMRILLDRYKGIIKTSDYNDKVKMVLAVPESLRESFAREIEEKTNSEVKPVLLNHTG